jgi:hypothetical protein
MSDLEREVNSKIRQVDSADDISAQAEIRPEVNQIEAIQSEASSEENETLGIIEKSQEVEIPVIPTDEPVEKSNTLDESTEIEIESVEPDQEKLEAEIENRVKASEAVRVKLISEMQNLENHREKLAVDIERLVSVREDLNQWISKRKESFAWKLTDSLRAFEKELEGDENKLREFALNRTFLDTEFGAKTRRWVMKAIGIPAVVLGSIFILMEILRSYSNLTDLQDPNNPAAAIKVREFDRWLAENLDSSHLQITFYLVAIFVLIFVGVLFAYSRRTSEFRQIVAQEAKLTKVMENAVPSIKNERERLDSLHPQVPQILELLSLGLHQPWLIDERYLSFQGELPDASKLPESLDVSVPTEKSSLRVFPQLVLRAMNQIQQPGWREVAFQRAIQKLSEYSGFGESDSALKELDQDQRRSGKRQILITLADKEAVLKAIGDDLVREFAATVQSKVLPLAQPEVISLRPDMLSHLLLTDNLVGETEEDVSPWEIRLSEIAGAGSPWAPGTFSGRGQLAAKHERKPDSVFIATDRASQYAHSEVKAFKEVYSGTRPFEVSIRVDLSEWCHPEEIAIFQDYQPSADEIRERENREQLSGESRSELENSITDKQENIAF